MSARTRIGALRPARSLARIVVALILAGSSGCATVAVEAPPAPAPVRQWAEGELITSLSERNQALRSMRALARVDYAGPEGKNGFQEAILVERPDRLRLETLSFLGAILIVTVNHGEILGHHTREGVFLRGEASKENLLRYTQIPLELHEITALLIGLPPVDTRQANQPNGSQVVAAAPGGGKDVVSFHGPENVPTRWERSDDSGRVEVSASFSDYSATAAGAFPSRILFESAVPKRRLEIRYQDPELNAAIPDELFTQQKPAHAKELPIEALGG